jgi:surface antigen
MSTLIKAVIPIFVGFMVASAQAQLLPTWETHIVLSQQDLDMIRGAVTQRVHGKPLGTTVSWSNPASGNSGSIKLVKKLVRKDQQCEELEYTVRSGGQPIYTEHYHFTSCLQPDGTWKIA